MKAVYSRSERSAQNLAATASELKLGKPAVYHDGDASANLDTLLGRSDISAVIVALPITQLPGVIIEALAAGKHVLSEKPVAPDVKTGAMLLATYNSQHKPKGLKWRVAENFEAEPGFRAAGKAIRDGKIGKVICFSSRVVDYIDKTSPCYLAPWRNIPDVGQSIVYITDLFLNSGVLSAASRWIRGELYNQSIVKITASKYLRSQLDIGVVRMLVFRSVLCSLTGGNSTQPPFYELSSRVL